MAWILQDVENISLRFESNHTMTSDFSERMQISHSITSQNSYIGFRFVDALIIIDPYTLTPPSPAWPAFKRHLGSQSVCLSRNEESSDQATFFPVFGFCEPVPTAASAFGSWLTELEPDLVFCCYSPSTLSFDIWGCFSAYQICTE